MKLSNPQLCALLAGVTDKLSRSSKGWGYDRDDGAWVVFAPATIESLCKHSLLDSNFDDERVHQGVSAWPEPRPQTLDGAVHAHSPGSPKFQVWTNGRGRDALRALGIIEIH